LARPPSSTPSSRPQSRTTQITSADMPSRSTRRSRLKSQRPNWKRSFSRVWVHKYDIMNWRSLTISSPFDCY
jgi:hypothetical protein